MIRRTAPLLLLALAAGAQAQFTGLPQTGQIDGERVLSTRYGKSAAPAAASLPGSAPASMPASPGLRGAAGIPAPFGGGFAGLAVDSTSDADQDHVPITFGQVFAPGEVKPGERLVARLQDGGALPLQVDAKARHPDGSIRHAVLSAIVPALPAHGSLALALAKDGAETPAKTAATPAALTDAGFRACVSATIEGKPWSACAERLLAGRTPQAWLHGPVAREWLVDAPLRNEQGAAHPHLAARFAVRWYPEAHKARVDVAVENDWAFEHGRRNITYDAAVTVGGKEVFREDGLTHLHHARWRKVFWWGGDTQVNLRHDSAYLIATRAVANYDRSVTTAENTLAGLAARWNGKATAPMGIGLALAYMPTTGGRNDIGLLPGWAAAWLLGMDARAGRVTVGTAELAGSWPMHYRDQRTGRPVSLVDYPYMTIDGHESDTRNPATGRLEAFPPCAAPHACDSPYSVDVAHQPNFAYLPYLLTGDYYLLEELQFWASYDAFSSNPGYRGQGKGLLHSHQVRGQAWALRTIAEAAWVTPDDDRLKAYFNGVVKHNLDWYNATYTDNPAANKLGVIVNGAAYSYDNGLAIAPWQDDFFTSAVGHVAELGFADARRLLAWKARFPVARMTAPGACWIDGAIYKLAVRRTTDTPVYATMAEAYAASHAADIVTLPCAGPEMAAAFKLRPGEMAGYSVSPTGFPSNMQPALAYAADAGGQAGRDAWKLFMARSVKPNYAEAPQFAIVPRGAPSAPPP